MLDAQFIRDNLEAVRTNCKNRNVQVDLDKVVALEVARKEAIQLTQAGQQRQNEVAKLIPKEKDPAKKQELIQEGRTLRENVGNLETQLKQIETDQHAILATYSKHEPSRCAGRNHRKR